MLLDHKYLLTGYYYNYYLLFLSSSINIKIQFKLSLDFKNILFKLSIICT